MKSIFANANKCFSNSCGSISLPISFEIVTITTFTYYKFGLSPVERTGNEQNYFIYKADLKQIGAHVF